MADSFSLVAVGGGPAGISLAIEALEHGFKKSDVLVLEKGPVCIEAIRKFYPDKKMTLANYKGLPTETLGKIPCFPDLTKAQTLDYFEDLIRKYNVPIEYNAEVSKVISDSGGFKIQIGHREIQSQYVGIGIGILGRPKKPEYKLPTDLRDHLLFDLTSQKIEKLKVLVVGGGDTSSEYCQVLSQEGNSVVLCYRGDSFHRMMDSNRGALDQLQASKRVQVRLSCEIQEIQVKEGKPLVVFKSGFESEIFDKVIFSIGGTTPINFLKTAGIHCEGNLPKYGEAGETNVPGIYLLGDLVSGKTGGSIITAYNSAYRCVQHILKNRK